MLPMLPVYFVTHVPGCSELLAAHPIFASPIVAYTNPVVEMQAQLDDYCWKEFFQHHRGYGDRLPRFFVGSKLRAMQDGVASVLNNANLFP